MIKQVLQDRQFRAQKSREEETDDEHEETPVFRENPAHRSVFHRPGTWA